MSLSRKQGKHKSILTEYEEISVFSGRPTECMHHLIFGIGMRELAEQDGIYIPLTNDEHNLSHTGTINQIHGNSAAESLSKIVGQLAWEKHYIAEQSLISEHAAREAFRARYGRSYL